MKHILRLIETLLNIFNPNSHYWEIKIIEKIFDLKCLLHSLHETMCRAVCDKFARLVPRLMERSRAGLTNIKTVSSSCAHGAHHNLISVHFLLNLDITSESGKSTDNTVWKGEWNEAYFLALSRSGRRYLSAHISFLSYGHSPLLSIRGTLIHQVKLQEIVKKYMKSCLQEYFSVYAPEHFSYQKWKRCFGEKCVLVLFGALLGNVDPENWGRF